MLKAKYLEHKDEKLPIIKELQSKFEEMYLFGDLKNNCRRFGLSEDRIRKIIYSKRQSDITTLNFDTIIRLSNMFDIPYEEFINYNASVDYYRDKSDRKLEEEDEMLKQYNVGKEWEEKVMTYYSNKGYFVYKIPTMVSGTVFDIIVVKGGTALMIECKHTETDKLYYKGCGLFKKRDELDHFVATTKNNIYIYVKSDKTGIWWTTWGRAKEIFEKKGFITAKDCFKCDIDI